MKLRELELTDFRGFSKADIRRIKADETRARGVAVLQEMSETT